MGDQGQEQEARTLIRLSLQSRQEALSNAVARLIVRNYELDHQSTERAQEIYSRTERNVYLFVANGTAACSRGRRMSRRGAANW